MFFERSDFGAPINNKAERCQSIPIKIKQIIIIILSGGSAELKEIKHNHILLYTAAISELDRGIQQHFP